MTEIGCQNKVLDLNVLSLMARCKLDFPLFWFKFELFLGVFQSRFFANLKITQPQKSQAIFECQSWSLKSKNYPATKVSWLKNPGSKTTLRDIIHLDFENPEKSITSWLSPFFPLVCLCYITKVLGSGPPSRVIFLVRLLKRKSWVVPWIRLRLNDEMTADARILRVETFKVISSKRDVWWKSCKLCTLPQDQVTQSIE